MNNLIGKLATQTHQVLVEPLLALALQGRRRRMVAVDAPRPVDLDVEWHRPDDCRAPCPLDPSQTPKLLRRYATAGPPNPILERLRLTPMLIDLTRFDRVQDFDALLKSRSSRSLTKIRRAQRLGYQAHAFMLPSHIDDMHAIRTSMAFRAAGPVFDRWFLKPDHIGRPATEHLPLSPPCCPVHWTIWWGVFVPEPGHLQGRVEVGERLVAYVKVMRIGDVVHYTEIMGHRERLADNVVLLLHHAIVRWLIEGEEPATRGARVLLYGAAEHGGEGLLTWKKRAGFTAGRLRVPDGP